MRRTLVAPWILVEILLMISLGVPPLAGGDNVRLDFAAAPPLLAYFVRDLLRLGLLLGVVEEDGGPVLRARVHTLPVLGRRVVHLVEEFDERGVGYLVGIKEHLKSFSV